MNGIVGGGWVGSGGGFNTGGIGALCLLCLKLSFFDCCCCCCCCANIIDALVVIDELRIGGGGGGGLGLLQQITGNEFCLFKFDFIIILVLFEHVDSVFII